MADTFTTRDLDKHRPASPRRSQLYFSVDTGEVWFAFTAGAWTKIYPTAGASPIFLPGEDGSDGEPGRTGLDGPAGTPGATGPAGAIGPACFLASEEGEAGEPGRPGLDGVAGPTGGQGATGPAIFLSADEGDDGEPGKPGDTGAAGVAGGTGGQGPAGPAVFLDAEQGDEGQPGASGAMGVTGGQGPTGPAVFLLGDDGPQGDVGKPGTDGQTGAQGPLGPPVFLVGDRGEDGLDGPIGATGTTGSQGPTGPPVFLVGEDGQDGIHALPGERGPTGTTGPQGAQGQAGPAVFLDAEPGEEGMVGSPGKNGMDVAGTMQGRLQLDSTTQISLRQYKGNIVEVNGSGVPLGAGGILLLTSDNRITSTGADAAAAMAASTLYYIYLSNPSASPFPSDLRASTTAPTLLNGIKYLGTSGNEANWRFIGYVRTSSTTTFLNSVTQRLVINYYNQRELILEAVPGYVNGNTESLYTTVSATWVNANAGTGNKLEFISDGENQVELIAYAIASHDTTGSVVSLGIGRDGSATDVPVAVQDENTLNQRMHLACELEQVFTEGYHSAELLIRTDEATATYYADTARNGAAADPKGTMLVGHVMG